MAKTDEEIALELGEAVRIVRDVIDHDLTLNQMLALLVIYAYPDCTSRHLQSVLGVSHSTAARIVAPLSQGRLPEATGLMLIDFGINLDDKRQRRYWLTRQGTRVAELLLRAMRRG